MRFGTWNVRRLYRTGSLTTAARELIKYKLDVVSVQEVRWDKVGTLRAGDFNFFLWKRKPNLQLGTGFYVNHRIVSAVRRVLFVSDRMSYVVLTGHWFNIIVLNVHAPSEEKSDDLKDGFYEELEQIFYNFLKYHVKILLGDGNAKFGGENIFVLTIGNESLPQDSSGNCVRIVNFAISKYLFVKSTIFPN